jgi:two-component system, NtrC family, sensor kinase
MEPQPPIQIPPVEGAEQIENLQFLRTLIETLPNPLYYEDRTGCIMGCNHALSVFLGSPAEAIIGKYAKDLLPEAEVEWQGSLGPDFLERPGVHEATFRRTLPDGRSHHAIFRKAPFFHADGTCAGHVATFLDVTQLKETEEALRRNESLFSAIHRHVVDLIAVIDPSGRRVYTSPSYQFVLGYSAEEMARLTSTELLHPEDIERVNNALQGIIEGRPTQGLEYRLRHKDGQWLYFESTAAIIRDLDSTSTRALVVARDITERKAAEQTRLAMEMQLRQAQKLEAIGQLAAGIAHEINTPTQYIGDNTAFLRDSFDEAFSLMGRMMAHLIDIRTMGGAAGEAAGKALEALEKTDLEYLGAEIPKAVQQSLDGVARISKIVKAMKDFSHPGGESKTLTDLHHAIESTITVSRNEWKYAASLTTDFDPTLPPVPCYPGELNQVILNLIVNAAHAIEAAHSGENPPVLGHITVKTRALEHEVEVSISDDGTGIAEEIQARMFEPFFTTKPVGKGSGQGLSIAHAVIVEKHQGRIEVRSKVGRGTTFILHLPLTRNERAESAP